MSPLEKLIKCDREARNYGFIWPNYHMVIDAVISEAEEVREALDDKEELERIKEEMGDLLHVTISLADFLKFDINELLIDAEIKFRKRSDALKIVMQKYNLDDFRGKNIEFMQSCWQEAKRLADTKATKK
jgi:uncharacterized protein YabN with tetrapyrrole methylase and pyrophosphatase domain